MQPVRGARLAQRTPKTSKSIADFLSLLTQRISWKELEGLSQRRHQAGRPTHRLTRGQLLAGLIFHYTISWGGTFREHLGDLLGIQMSESSLSQRRQALPFEVFKELLRRVLRPITGSSAGEGFYRSWRLVAIDGTSFSLANTPQVQAHTRKGGNGRGRAAFAKLYCAALVELVHHNPLGACLGRQGESEWELALNVLEYLPEKCLLLGDRLYGCGAFLAKAKSKFEQLGGHALLRVKKSLKALQVLREFKDGSRLIEIKALEKGDTHQVAQTMVVREICAKVQRRGFPAVELRLWTTLLDPVQAPASELVALYARRWEQELYFGELKYGLDVNDLLLSQTVETAAQEVAVMIIGSSLIAHERSKLQPGQELSSRVSFRKTWQLLEPLWLTLLVGHDLLSEEQKVQFCQRFYALAAGRIKPKKRIRTYSRVLRRPVQAWPRKHDRHKGSKAPLNISIQKN